MVTKLVSSVILIQTDVWSGRMKRGSTFATLAAADKASSIAFLQLACDDQGYQFVAFVCLMATRKILF